MPRITFRDWPSYSPTDQNRRENTVMAARLMMNGALTAPNVGGLPMTEGEIVYGEEVSVFEALPEPGGMMRVGIPAYRLPQELLDKEIQEIKSAGVNIKTETRVESLGCPGSGSKR